MVEAPLWGGGKVRLGLGVVLMTLYMLVGGAGFVEGLECVDVLQSSSCGYQGIGGGMGFEY